MSPCSPSRPRVALAATGVVAVLLAGCARSEEPVQEGAGASSTSSRATTATTATTGGIEGVEVFSVDDVAHVTGSVDYAQLPPVGGPHTALWLNCGFYSEPVPVEPAVHSLEHGAVWITYEPDLDPAQVDVLRGLARDSYVLVSPWPDGSLPSPVVASAWNRQLQLPSAEDDRLTAFVDAFRMGTQSPEPGAACSGGLGEPE